MNQARGESTIALTTPALWHADADRRSRVRLIGPDAVAAGRPLDGFAMLPRMTLLLETAGHDSTGAIVVGVLVFLALAGMLSFVTLFGSGRPHTKSE